MGSEKKAENIMEFYAPVAAIMMGYNHHARRDTLVLAARWTLNREFCIRLGDNYAVFAPQSNILAFRVPGLDDSNFGSWYLFELVKIEAQASCPVLCPSGVLMQPEEARPARREEFSCPFPSACGASRPAQAEHPAGPCKDRDAKYLRRPQASPGM